MSEYISVDLVGIYYTGLNQVGKRPSYDYQSRVRSFEIGGFVIEFYM